MSDFFSSNQNLFTMLIIFSTIVATLALAMTFINMFRINKLSNKLSILFTGKKGADLENIILHNNKKITELDTEIQELFNISNTINKQSHKSLHKVGLMRFNPFGEHAGNQSFALALLNSNDDGLVLSSLHTREGTRVYAKQIIKGQVINNELTQEEQKVIVSAK
jgi:hypothetical protein